MQKYEAMVTSKGQMTLPAKLRAALRIQPGDRVALTLDDNGDVRLRKSANAGVYSDLVGVLGRYATDEPVSREDIRAAADEALREQEERVAPHAPGEKP